MGAVPGAGAIPHEKHYILFISKPTKCFIQLIKKALFEATYFFPNPLPQ
jgi:hypothetical protein